MKPNILYIMADQLRYQSCGYAGDPHARTPNIDRLAAGAVNFTNAISNTPVCAAYRASLLTGKYTTSTGMVINELRLNPDHHQRPLAKCLTDDGYTTAYVGKWHLYANELGNHFDPKNSFVPPGKHRLGFDGFFSHYGFHHQYYGDKAYYHLDTPDKIHFAEGVYEPDGQTDLALDRLRDAVSADDPFALFLSLGTPHDPWTELNVPKEYLDMYRDVEFETPENYSDDLDPYGDAWSDREKSPQQINSWKRVYYAMTANLDYNVGRILDALDELGIADNTVVVFTSDHGEMFGAHGRMMKNIFYEEAARIPFLLRWPSVTEGRTSDVLLSTVDIMPTLLGLAGLSGGDEIEGMDLSSHIRGVDGPEPPFAFLQNTGACASWEDGHEWRAVRDKRFTYAVFRVDGKELLFDHQADPLQLNELSGDRSYRDVLLRLREQARAKMEELGDGFEVSSFYREHWVSEDRLILKTAKNP
jgi:arylsulfatase A-like enzyme